MKKILYRKGYKYQLHRKYECRVSIYPDNQIDTKYIGLDIDGLLIIKAGYAWNGASGPTIDTKSSMRGSLVHDALYQLFREGKLDIQWRDEADEELQHICHEDGMSWFRSKVWERAVKVFARASALTKNKRKILEAP